MGRRTNAFLLGFALLATPALAGHGGAGGHRSGNAGSVVERQVGRAQRGIDRGSRGAARAVRRGAHHVERRAAAVEHRTRHGERRSAAVQSQARHVERRAAAAQNRVRHVERRAVVAQRHGPRVDRRAVVAQGHGPRIDRRAQELIREQRAVGRTRAAERRAWVPERQATVERERVARENRAIAGADRRSAWVAEQRAMRRQTRFAGAAPRRFRGLDGDGDGIVSRAEWRGNDRSFANHDWNGDGILSGVEVRPGAARGAHVQRVGFFERFVPLPRRLVSPVAIGLPLPAPDIGLPLPLPSDLVPLPPLVDAFPVRLDENRLEGLVRTQGFLSVATVVERPRFVPVDRALLDGRFVALDLDGDRFVTLDEWSGPRRMFRTLDLDGDRRLVVRELVVPASPPLRAVTLVDRDRYLAFNLLDIDDDGIVAPWEWTGDMDVFFLLDESGDGVLEQAEYLGLVRARPLPMRYVVDGALDCDHDGLVSRSEWVGDPFRFVSLDLDGDGVLRRPEAVVGSLLARI
jgi:hypothetical protein